MGSYQLSYKPFGESAILVEWPQRISKEILEDICSFVITLEKYMFEEILEFNYVYNSLLICYRSNKFKYTEVENKLNSLYNEEFEIKQTKKVLWTIPVCYDAIFGLDLSFIATENKLVIEEIIELHSNTNYTVYGIGFLPGFLYLGGLNERLYIPRKSTPRLEVPKGAVAIGGNQTGIYPQNSPGGWNIIGKTPVKLFNVKNKKPCVFKPGDEVRFIPIPKEEFEIIENAQKAGKYKFKQTFIND